MSRIVRRLLKRVQDGRLSPRDLEGLPPDALRAFSRAVGEWGRQQLASYDRQLAELERDLADLRTMRARFAKTLAVIERLAWEGGQDG